MAFVLVFGAIAIVFLVALIAFLIIKLWLKLISSVEKSQERVEKSIKKDGYRFGPADKILDRKKGGIMYTREQKEYCRTGPFGLCLLWFLQSASV